jgi:hypothetical protein
VLIYSCYTAKPFSLSNSAQPFLLQCSVILGTMLSYFSELSHSSCYSVHHFLLSYNAHPFFTATVLMHSCCYSTQSFLVLGRDARAGGVSWLGRAGAHKRSHRGAQGCTGRVDWLGQLVGPLGLGDGPLVHHMMRLFCT